MAVGREGYTMSCATQVRLYVGGNFELWLGAGPLKKSRNEGGSHDLVDNKGPIF